MGPPPPPPPPPAGPILALRRGPPAHAPRRDNNPLPAPPKQTRPSLDPASLQHAAARLRKTVDGQQIRSDSQNLSNGPLARQDQPLPGRDWPSHTQQHPLGGYQAGEEVYATPSRALPPSPFVDVRGRADPVNASQSAPNQKFKTFTPPTVTIQPPSEPSIYSNTKSSQYSSDRYSPSNQYSVPAAKNTYSSYSSTNSNTYAPPPLPNSVPPPLPSTPSPRPYSPQTSRNIEVTKTYTFETANQPPQTRTYHYSSSSGPGTNNNYIENYSTANNQHANQGNYNANTNYANVPLQQSTGYSSPVNRSSSPYITDARARIHDFATSTPADEGYSIPVNNKSYQSEYSSIRKSTSSPAPRHPGEQFARELRDQGLTQRQQYANQFQKSGLRDQQLPFDAENIYKKSFKNDEVDRLVSQMNQTMHTGYGRAINICVGCNEEVTNDKPGCTAMDKIYHVACFKCKRCGSTLAGASFYNVDGDAVCERDYQESLERCTKCGQAIADKLLRACGGCFHVTCFTCTVCNISLDGVPFTVDPENLVYCVPCYHQKFAPRCAVCSNAIVPKEGEKESVRVVAMDKSFHVECYRCEDCGLQLSSKIEGQGCYPIDQHLFCKTCNSNRLRIVSNA